MTDENTPVPQTRVITARRLRGSEDEAGVNGLYSLFRYFTFLDPVPTMRRVFRSDERVGLFSPGGTLAAAATFGIAKNQKDLGVQLNAEVEIQDHIFPVLTMERTCAMPNTRGFDILRLLALQLASRLNVGGRRIGAVIGVEEEPAALHSLDLGYHLLWIAEKDRAAALIPHTRFRQSIAELQRLIAGEMPAYRWEDAKWPFQRHMPGPKKRI